METETQAPVVRATVVLSQREHGKLTLRAEGQRTGSFADALAAAGFEQGQVVEIRLAEAREE